MSIDRTQIQDPDEHRQARQLSLTRDRPPVDVPGYETLRFLGSGAYGEVWVAVDRNTGRQVAIKFYAHRGGLDWSLLLREVEKLAFLSADRYVVQLLDVGWDSDPPYYVMEYVEQGSLDDLLKMQGPLPVKQAVSIFREVAVGLLHAHAKGVLHCDLKPANVLLDQDGKPRLADFGQSRLSNEQTPALGTLFYMAPEQADMRAVPDARWDVYALGALLYCMLTGAPPHRTDVTVTEIERTKDLEQRLAKYRERIVESAVPDGHRKVRGVDRGLAELVDRCLAPRPADRFANIQSILDALDDRQLRKRRRPLILLGALGPALLLLVMCILTWQWFNTYFQQFGSELRVRTLESSKFAARHAASAAAGGLEQRFRAVEGLAREPELHAKMEAIFHDPEMSRLTQDLSSTEPSDAELRVLRNQYRSHPLVAELNATLHKLAHAEHQPEATSWNLADPRGLQLARTPLPNGDHNTIAVNWAFRTYFNGKRQEERPDWRPGPDDRLRRTHLSAAFLSRATERWAVAISTPVLKPQPEGEPLFLGVLAYTVEIGRFLDPLSQSAEEETRAGHVTVLVDWREGPNQGLILQHPLFEEYGTVPEKFNKLRATLHSTPDEKERSGNTDVRIPQREAYKDPLAEDPDGNAYDKLWLAEIAPVMIRSEPTGWYIIVQESYEDAIGSTLERLRASLLRSGLLALAVIGLVIALLWAFVVRPIAQET